MTLQPLVYCVVAVAGAGFGALALLTANQLVRRYANLSPVDPAPKPYPAVPWVAVSALIASIALEGRTMIGMASHATTLSFLGTLAIGSIEILILLVIFLVDLRAHLILDVVTLPAIAVVLALRSVDPDLHWQDALVGAAIGLGVYGLLYGLGWLLTRQEALGLGDVKLAALIGAMVGYRDVVPALLAAAVLGGITSLLLLWLRRRKRDSYLPYGVFLAVGAAAYIISG